MSTKIKTAYVCSDCGSEYSKWQGQCNDCKAWNTLTEVRLGIAKRSAPISRMGFAAAVDGQVKTLPEVVSLYGSNRKPTYQQMEGLDYIIYDIQDVGARFYTYITTLGLIMESASAANVKVALSESISELWRVLQFQLPFFYNFLALKVFPLYYQNKNSQLPEYFYQQN